MIEQVGRRNELAMYMFPKFLESLPVYLGKMKQDRFFQIKFGHNLLLALTMAITSFVYNTDVGSIKTSILFLLDLVIGRDQNQQDTMSDPAVAEPGLKEKESILPPKRVDEREKIEQLKEDD